MDAMPAFFAVLACLLEPRRAALRSMGRAAIAVVEGGRYLIDPAAPSIVAAGWSEAAELKMLVNQQTLDALLSGQFDPARPPLGSLCLCSGDPGVLRAIAGALGGAQGWLELRASAKDWVPNTKDGVEP
jgi:hypothetical protein